MPYSCAVTYCKSRSDKNMKLTFHSFPRSNSDLCKKWVAAVGRHNWIPTKFSKLCSAHFTEKSFRDCNGRKYLHPNVVPSIFKFQYHKHKSTLQSGGATEGNVDSISDATVPTEGESNHERSAQDRVKLEYKVTFPTCNDLEVMLAAGRARRKQDVSRIYVIPNKSKQMKAGCREMCQQRIATVSTRLIKPSSVSMQERESSSELESQTQDACCTCSVKILALEKIIEQQQEQILCLRQKLVALEEEQTKSQELSPVVLE